MKDWPEDRKRDIILSAGLPIPLVDIRIVDEQVGTFQWMVRPWVNWWLGPPRG